MTDIKADMMSEDEFLEHFGIKGMKWGKRKAAPNPVHVSADAARFNKINSRLKTKGLDNLSNDDLAKLNKRNQLLSEYKKNNPGKLEKGAKATQDTLKKLKTVGTIITAGAALTAAGVAISKGLKAPDPKMAEVAKTGAMAVAKVLTGL